MIHYLQGDQGHANVTERILLIRPIISDGKDIVTKLSI